MDEKTEKFQANFSDLNAWIKDSLAHSLAKKLSRGQVEQLIEEFRRIARESRSQK